jgi:hypothetical protein
MPEQKMHCYAAGAAMMRKDPLTARLLFLALFLASGAAWAEAGSSPNATDTDVLRRCQSYADCMLVWGGCNDMAINKRYAHQFKPSSVCAQSAPHDPKALPTCTNGLCEAVIPDNKQ